MKRALIVLIVLLLILCEGFALEIDRDEALGDFRFHSLSWGIDWPSAEAGGAFQLGVLLRESRTGMTVQFDNAVYLGIPVSAALVFDTNGISEIPGLVAVMVRYEEEDENELIAGLEEIYGVKNEYYVDPNGVMISIDPAGWTSEETMEASLSEEEKRYFKDLMKDYDELRVEALLRSPLVTVRVDEDLNLIEFNGNHAAVAKYVKSAYEQESIKEGE